MPLINNLANRVTAVTAVASFCAITYIYMVDFLYIGENTAVRNIGWATNQICNKGNDNDVMREYIAAEFQRYERYTGRVHVNSNGNLCDE
jgi:hypothetical protein